MSLTTVEVQAFSGPALVEIVGSDEPSVVQIVSADEPEVIYINQGPAGAPGGSGQAQWGLITGTLSAQTDLNTALGLKAPLASPTFTGTVNGITASMVGLGNVNNTSDANKPVSTAQQTALNLKANLASPTFTGTVNGITATMVGLGNVNNTSDASKPVSTAQQTALDLKANLAGPTFTGTVSLPSTTSIGNVSSTEIGYVDGVTSSIQTQLDSKASTAQALPVGGTTGQVLSKIDGTNYNTQWTTPASATQAESLVHAVKNGNVVAMTKGQAVYITGASGMNIIIGLAQANSEPTSSKTIGLVTTALAKNGQGYVITDGLLSGLNTSAATADGDPVWLSPTTAGGLIYGLANKPSSPNHLVYIGVVSHKHATQGEILVKIQNGFELQELHNVTIDAAGNPLAVNDILICDNSTSNHGYWKNTPLSGVAVDLISNQTILGEKTFSEDTFFGADITNNSSWGILGSEGAFAWLRGSFYSQLIAPTTLTADHVLTIPDASGTLALTSGVVDLVSNQTVDGNKTFIGDTTIGDASILQQLNWSIQPNASATFASLTSNSGSSNYWSISQTGSAYFKGLLTLFGSASTSSGRIYFEKGDGSSGDLYPSTLTGVRYWQLPDASGTIALTSGTQTFSGAQTFSGQVELTGQAATNGTSAMNRALSDTRYLVEKRSFATADQSITNSATLTDSTYLTLTLETGTWEIETLELVGSSSFATAGCRSQLFFTGTTSAIYGTKFRANANNAQPLNASPSWTGTAETVNSLSNSPTQSQVVVRRGQYVVTGSGTLKVQFAQSTATATQTATLFAGSFLRATKIA
jgi:hypothetical protein